MTVRIFHEFQHRATARFILARDLFTFAQGYGLIGQIVGIDSYFVHLHSMESDGEAIIFSVNKNFNDFRSIGWTSTVDIKSGRTTTIFDLSITNAGAGHEVVEDGEDTSYAQLVTIFTPRVF